MIKYTEIQGIRKKAGVGALLPTATNIFNTAGDLTAIGATYLVAASLMAGLGTGWVAAKATAKGKQDYDTAKKGYENEALSADLGYFANKIRQERDALKNTDKPKSMRAFG